MVVWGFKGLEGVWGFRVLGVRVYALTTGVFGCGDLGKFRVLGCGAWGLGCRRASLSVCLSDWKKRQR